MWRAWIYHPDQSRPDVIESEDLSELFRIIEGSHDVCAIMIGRELVAAEQK